MTNVLDENALMDRVDGDVEFLEETVVMLDEDSPPLLDQIQRAVVANDAAALVKPAHALKGMVSNFCAPRSEEAARELERMGRQEHLAGVEAAAECARQEIELLREALHRFLRNRSE